MTVPNHTLLSSANCTPPITWALSAPAALCLMGHAPIPGVVMAGAGLSAFGPLIAAGRNRTYAGLVFNSNSSAPNLARFQTLDAKGSLNTYGSEDPTLTRLMAEAAVLPLSRAEAAWKKVYAQAVELAWFAPVAAVHVCYFATSDVKMPQAGQSLVVDLIDVVPAK